MSRTAADLGAMAIAFLGATAIAELFGAANMGTALAFGQIAFTVAVVWAMARA